MGVASTRRDGEAGDCPRTTMVTLRKNIKLIQHLPASPMASHSLCSLYIQDIVIMLILHQIGEIYYIMTNQEVGCKINLANNLASPSI